jgi:hypothetical protein
VSPSRTFYLTDRKIDTSTITEIQEAIVRLPANEKSALASWLQSQEEPVMSEAEKAAVLLARLDKAAAQLDAREGIPSTASVRTSADGLESSFRSSSARTT